jgi:hypothetical protein
MSDPKLPRKNPPLPPEPARRAPPTHLEVAVSMLTAGLDAVKAIRPEPSKHTLIRAAFELQRRESFSHGDDLYAYAKATHPSRRGKRAPVAGDSRDYRARNTDGTVLVRIPVAMISVPDGGLVRARFGDEYITLEKSPTIEKSV